ncbi:MAG TPA: hypothetical protein VGE09_08725 [Pseudoxanthomonas sp.]
MNAQLAARQYAAAAANWDNASPDEEETRDEAIAFRADELTAERMSEAKLVQDAISDALGNDYDAAFAAELRRFFIAFDEAQTDDRMADAGHALFCFLRQQVKPLIHSDAMTDAQAEQARFEANSP